MNMSDWMNMNNEQLSIQLAWCCRFCLLILFRLGLALRSLNRYIVFLVLLLNGTITRSHPGNRKCLTSTTILAIIIVSSFKLFSDS